MLLRCRGERRSSPIWGYVAALVGASTLVTLSMAALHRYASDQLLTGTRERWSHFRRVYNRNGPHLEWLLRLSANPNVANMDGTTALMYASLNGDEPLVKLLLNYGADPRISNSDGMNALDYAALNNRYRVIELLRGKRD
jgi:hypothetical protein